MTIYRLSTAIIYSTAYRLPIWIAYKISYKHSLYFGIPDVSLDSIFSCDVRSDGHMTLYIARLGRLLKWDDMGITHQEYQNIKNVYRIFYRQSK